MLNLLRIARITGKTELEEKAAGIGRAFATQVSRAPSAHAQLLYALEFGDGPSYEVVIAGTSESSSTEAMIAPLRRNFTPNKVLLFRSGAEAPPVTELASFTENQESRQGQSTAYVCRNHRCKLPTTDPAVMIASLLETTASPEKGK